MHKFLIAQYISKLNYEDIKSFANKNNIYLTNQELDIILLTLKNNWETILYHDPTTIFNNLKDSLSPTSYQKGIELYNKYYQIYKNYL